MNFCEDGMIVGLGLTAEYSAAFGHTGSVGGFSCFDSSGSCPLPGD